MQRNQIGRHGEDLPTFNRAPQACVEISTVHPDSFPRILATWEAGASATTSQSLEPGFGKTDIRGWGAEPMARG